MEAGGIQQLAAITDQQDVEPRQDSGKPRLPEWARRLILLWNRRWPASLRWVAAVAVGAVCTLVRLTEPLYLPDAVLAAAAAVVLLCSLGIPLTPVSEASHFPYGAMVRRYALLALDISALAALILFSGGTRSALVPFLVLPIFVAPFVAGTSAAYGSAAAAILLLGGTAALVQLSSPSWLPPAATAGTVPWSAGRLLAELTPWAVLFLLSAHLTTSVRSRLSLGRHQSRDTRSQLERQIRELEEANLRLEKMGRARTRPMMGVSEHLKAHLSSTQGTLEMIMASSAADPDPSVRLVVGLAHDSTASMLELVEDLAYLDQLREADTVLARELLDLGKIAMEAVRHNDAAAKAKRLKTTVRIDDALPRILGNHDATLRLVHNLVENAIKYTLDGGRTAVSVESRPGKVVLSVTDTGIGIRAEDLPRIFDEFFRADNARRVKRLGAGLGLAVVSQIARLQEGSVSVTSQLGRGSTFTVDFPAIDLTPTTV